MNVPVYFTPKVKRGGMYMMAVPFLIPTVTFSVSYLFYGGDPTVTTITTIFSLFLAALSFISLRSMFGKYFVNKPAMILKDDVIETATGKEVHWDWFDKAVVFTCEGKRLLGLHRKPEIKKDAIEEATYDFTGIFAGFSFAIQFDQFSTEESELIKLFHSKLPVVVDHKNYDLGDEVEAEAIR